MKRNTKANLATSQSIRQPSTAARLLLLSAIILLSLPSHARKSFGEITESDKISLPPVCRLILVDKPAAHQPVGQVENAELLNRPEYRLAKGNIHLHHYCYGLLNKNRYFSSKSRFERDGFLIETISEIDYVLKHSPKEWPYFYELYHEQAEMYFLAGDIPKALNKANSALTHQPDFDKSHALISDIYLKQGKKGKAIEQLQVALKANPTSKRLLRRLKELNPTDPLLTAAESMTAKPAQEPSTVQKEANIRGSARQENGEATLPVETKTTEPVTMEPQAKSQIHSPGEPDPALLSRPANRQGTATTRTKMDNEGNAREVPLSAQGAASSAEQAVSNSPVIETREKAAENPQSGSPTNPYCRFCPTP